MNNKFGDSEKNPYICMLKAKKMIEFRKRSELPLELKNYIQSLGWIIIDDYECIVEESDGIWEVYCDNSTMLEILKRDVCNVFKMRLNTSNRTYDFTEAPLSFLHMADFFVQGGVVKKNRLGVKNEEELREVREYLENRKRQWNQH